MIFSHHFQALLEGSGDGYDDEKASLYANILMVGSLLVGTIMTFMTKEVLHRQNAQYIDEKHPKGIENNAYNESPDPSTRVENSFPEVGYFLAKKNLRKSKFR